jgi:hypothetical protein
MIVNSYDAGSYKDADPISMIKDADPDIIQDAFAVQIDAGPKSITFQEQESSASLARR